MDAQGLQLHPKVRWRWEGKDKVLLSNFVGLNRAGGQVLESYRSADTPAGVAQALAAYYPHVAAEKLLADVEHITQRLLKLHVLVPKGTGQFDAGDTALRTSSSYVAHLASFFGNWLTAPVSVSAEITFACNARCAHCYTLSPRRLPDELATADWQRLIDEIAGLHVFAVSFTGGDPLLRPDLETLVAHAHGRGLSTSMQTNGFALTESRLDALLAAGLNTVYISLDGADAATHDAFRGLDGLYDRALQALGWLAARGVTVQVNTMVTTRNLGQILDIVRLAAGLNVRFLKLIRPLAVGRAAGTPLNPSRAGFVRLLADLYDHQLAHPDSPTSLSYPTVPAAYYAEAIGLAAYEQLKKEMRIGWCAAGITSCAITPAGDVRPCDVSAGVRLGNILEQPLGRIWTHSPIFSHLREMTRRQEEPCGACSLVEQCLSGCKALPEQIGKGGKPLASDPACAACFATLPAEQRRADVCRQPER